MKIKKVTISGFRSIKNAEFPVLDFLCLVGRNNHGKSNILLALDVFFNGSKVIPDSCFYTYKENGLTKREQCLEIVVQFDRLSDTEKQLLSEYIRDDSITLMRRYKFENKVLQMEYLIEGRIPDESWLRDDFEHYSNREELEALPIKDFIPKTGRITRPIYSEAIIKYRKQHDSEIKYSFTFNQIPSDLKKELETTIPKYFLIPAVIDANSELKPNGDSLYSRIINSIVDRIMINDTDFQDILNKFEAFWSTFDAKVKADQVPELVHVKQQLRDELKSWNVNPIILFDKPDFIKVMKVTSQVLLDDGIDTNVDGKGNGLQRSLIFALFKIIAHQKNNNKNPTIIFALEEPELYLHPHMCRSTYEMLKELSINDQVLLCTHSQNFIDMEDYKQILIVKKGADGTNVHYVKNELFPGDLKKQFALTKYFTADRNEVFFSRKVILVEGQTERSLLPLIARRLSIFDHSISIVDCGGKHNLPLFMNVLNAFKIPYLVIHDEDPVGSDYCPNGALFKPDKYRNMMITYRYNTTINNACDTALGKIEMIPGEFEDMLGVTGGEMDHYGKPYAATRKYDDVNQAIPPKLELLVRDAYSR